MPIRAPAPPGPQILWPLTDTRSAPSASMSKGMRPAICVASQWNSAPAARTRSAISPTGLSTPVSLLAAITDTSTTSSAIRSCTASGSTMPPRVTSITSSLASPRSASQRAVRATEACSTADTSIRRLPSGAASTAPRKARLLASVAPEVNTTPPGRPPTSAATCSRASSTAAACLRPNRCTDEALPTEPVSVGTIASATRGSSGDEAL